ncbi:MAG: twin-arginine translocase TatA/TatE family subunit [Acidobacteria bacterium]|nr:twin-arginine translocase TatA/TatE family subunit [Acidobacteriota bacterium]
MFGSLGWTEILFILVIALIIFGPRKLPQLGRTLGESLAQFRRASEDFKRSWEQEITLEEKRLSPPTPSPSTPSPVDEPSTASEPDSKEQSGVSA